MFRTSFKKRFGLLLGGAVSLVGLAIASHSADLNGDGEVNQTDLAQLVAEWRGTGLADLNHDGSVTYTDAGILLSAWGMLVPPGDNVATESWTLADGSAWPAQWTVDASSGSTASVLGGRGQLLTSTLGTFTGPYVRARVSDLTYSAIDVSYLAQPTPGGTNLELRLFTGNPSQLSFVLQDNGWYLLRKGSTTITDATVVGDRPPAAGTGPWRVRVRVERNYNATDVYMRRWADGAAEPHYWYHVVWQDTDPSLYNARGPIEFSVQNRGTGWEIDDFRAEALPNTPALVKTTPIQPIDATADLHIPYDGRDVSAIMRQALSRLPAGSTVHLEPNGRYGIETIMRVSNASNLTIVGHGAVFSRTPQGVTDHYIEFTDSNTVHMSDFEVAGKDTGCQYIPAVEFSSGVSVRHAENVTLEDLYVHDVGGDSVVGGTGTRNLTVRRLTARCMGRQGISFNNGDGFLFEDSSIEWAGRSAIDLEPYATDWIANNVIIRRITAAHFINNFLSAGGAGQHDGLTVEDNNVVGGLAFAGIGNIEQQVRRLIIRRNNYTWDDPELNQYPRNLGSLSVRALDNVVIEDNNLTFQRGGNIFIQAPGGSIVSNYMRGAQDGLLVDTLGNFWTTEAFLRANNTVLRQDGTPAAIIVQ